MFNRFLKTIRPLKKYCSLVHESQNYLLAAMHQSGRKIIFEQFSLGTLKALAKTHHHYLLALPIEAEALISKTWFFQKHTSLIDIYQHISKESDYFYFDIEILKEELDEILVVSYAMNSALWHVFKKPYQEVGFQIAAVEPLSQLHKRNLSHPWQLEALKNPYGTSKSAEISLKLLDRNNFYGN